MPYVGQTITEVFPTSISVDSATISGNTTIGGTLGVTGASTLSGTLGVTGVSTLSDNIVFGASGKGVHLGVTSATASNLVDDYEEGTWTPTDGSGANLSLTVLDATYTKIGRLVQCYAQVSYPSTSNTAQAQIGGLPFTNIAGNGANHGAFTVFANYNTDVQIDWLNTSGGAGTQAHSRAGGAVTNANISAKQFRLVWIYQQN